MYWLHNECGYTFIGETSLYRLLYPELRVLHAGYRATQRQKRDKQKGVSPEDRSRLSKFNDKLQDGSVGESGGLSDSEYDAADVSESGQQQPQTRTNTPPGSVSADYRTGR